MRAEATRHLLVIDQVPLLDEAFDACQVAYGAIEQLKEELRRFERQDQPAYERWYNSTFGGYLTLIREFADSISKKKIELEMLRKRHWARFFTCDHEAAASAAADESASRHFDTDEAEVGGFSERAWGEDDDLSSVFEDIRYETGRFYDDEERWFYEEDSDSTRRFERRFSRESYDWWSYRARGRADGDRARGQGAGGHGSGAGSGERSSREEAAASSAGAEAGSAEGTLETRLRERYRILVKKLHPDLNAELSPEAKALWHRVQNAYRERNIEQLDLLAALSDVFSGGLTRSASLYQLRLVAREVEALVAPLRRQLEQARASRAWGFSALKDRGELRGRVEREFQRDLAGLRRELEQLQAQVTRFSARAEAAIRPELSL